MFLPYQLHALGQGEALTSIVPNDGVHPFALLIALGSLGSYHSFSPGAVTIKDLFCFWNNALILVFWGRPGVDFEQEAAMENQQIGQTLCPDCFGTGKKNNGTPCPACKGTGLVAVYSAPAENAAEKE